jgi:hypothetical protein
MHFRTSPFIGIQPVQSHHSYGRKSEGEGTHVLRQLQTISTRSTKRIIGMVCKTANQGLGNKDSELSCRES